MTVRLAPTQFDQELTLGRAVTPTCCCSCCCCCAVSLTATAVAIPLVVNQVAKEKTISGAPSTPRRRSRAGLTVLAALVLPVWIILVMLVGWALPNLFDSAVGFVLLGAALIAMITGVVRLASGKWSVAVLTGVTIVLVALMAFAIEIPIWAQFL